MFGHKEHRHVLGGHVGVRLLRSHIPFERLWQKGALVPKPVAQPIEVQLVDAVPIAADRATAEPEPVGMAQEPTDAVPTGEDRATADVRR